MRPQKHDTFSKEFREEAIRQAREERRPLTASNGTIAAPVVAPCTTVSGRLSSQSSFRRRSARGDSRSTLSPGRAARFQNVTLRSRDAAKASHRRTCSAWASAVAQRDRGQPCAPKRGARRRARGANSRFRTRRTVCFFLFALRVLVRDSETWLHIGRPIIDVLR